MTDFRTMSSESAVEHWGVISPFIADAVEHSGGDLTLQGIYSRILEKRMQVMVTVDEDNQITGASVTEFPILATGEVVLRVVCLGGKDFDEWGEKYVDILKNWASEKGINRVQLTGRRGWEKKLKNLGWKTTSINMEVKVDG